MRFSALLVLAFVATAIANPLDMPQDLEERTRKLDYPSRVYPRDNIEERQARGRPWRRSEAAKLDQRERRAPLEEGKDAQLEERQAGRGSRALPWKREREGEAELEERQARGQPW